MSILDFSYLGVELETLGVVIRPLGVNFRPLKVNFRPLGVYFNFKKSILGLYDPIFWAHFFFIGLEPIFYTYPRFYFLKGGKMVENLI